MVVRWQRTIFPANSVVSRDDFVVLPRVLFLCAMTSLEMLRGCMLASLVYPIQSGQRRLCRLNESIGARL